MYGIRVGMVRVGREIRERMSLVTGEVNINPSQVVNSKPLIVAINSFYRTSQLSTIVDQTNPLSELDNLRRITVGGPGGIEKERASFSIRDISRESDMSESYQKLRKDFKELEFFEVIDESVGKDHDD